MPQDILIGHGLAPEAKSGQNGGKNPSWQKIGEEQPRSTVAKSIMAANKAKLPSPDAPDWQTRAVPSKGAVPINPGTKGASKGGTVPAATARRDKSGVTRAVGHGRMK